MVWIDLRVELVSDWVLEGQHHHNLRKKQCVFFCQAVMDPAGPVGASEARRAGGVVAEFRALKESAARQAWCQQK